MKQLFNILLAVILSICVGCIKESDGKSFVSIGDQVPRFTVTSADGQVFSSEMLSGKKSMIFLFYTYCGDCQRALPVIEQVWLELKDDPGVNIIPIARDQTADEVSGFEYTMPFYPDPQRAVYSLFASVDVPRVYLVDSSSRITWMAVTNLGVSAEELVGMIKSQD